LEEKNLFEGSHGLQRLCGFKIFLSFIFVIPSFMAKKSMIARERKRQAIVQKYVHKRFQVKEALKVAATPAERAKLISQLQALPRNSSPVRLHNRCAVTGRPKGFYRAFGLSRHVLREMANEGLLPGVTKASW
jgi:small subunit ribosomal protein S14